MHYSHQQKLPHTRILLALFATTLKKKNNMTTKGLSSVSKDKPSPRSKFSAIKLFYREKLTIIALAKRQFTIDTGKEQIPVEGQLHRNVAVKYLMKRRRSLLMTKNSEKIEKLWEDLPKNIKIIGKQVTREYEVKWERLGTEESEVSRFAFTLQDLDEKAKNHNSPDFRSS